MIELTYAEILETRFPEAFNSLLEYEFDIDDAAAVVGSIELLTKGIKDAKDGLDALIREYGAEVKEGDKVTGFNVALSSEEKQKEFVSKRESHLETKVVLPMEKPLTVKAIKPIHLAVLKKLVVVKA